MLRSRSLIYVLMALAMGFSSNQAQAELRFYDDFEDGDIDDNSPVSWRPLHDGGEISAVGGALELRPHAQSEVAAVAHRSGHDRITDWTSIIVTMQLSAGNDDFTAGIIGRSTEDGAYKLSLSRAGALALTYNDVSLGQAQLPFDPVHEPVSLRLDLLGAGSYVYAWNGPTPDYWNDFVFFGGHTTFSLEGGLGVFAESASADSDDFVRFEEFESLPEPSSLLMGILGATGLICSHRFRREARRHS